MSFTYHFKAHIYRGIKRLHTVYIDMMIRPCPVRCQTVSLLRGSNSFLKLSLSSPSSPLFSGFQGVPSYSLKNDKKANLSTCNTTQLRRQVHSSLVGGLFSVFRRNQGTQSGAALLK